MARAVPFDTLEALWQHRGREAQSLGFPRTALFLPDTGSAGTSRLVVSDAEGGRLLFFSEDGRLADSVASDSFAAPYLIGRRGDTLVVLSPRERRVSFVSGGNVTRSMTLDLPPVEDAPLLWAVAAEGALFAKTIDSDGQTSITRHRLGDGQVTARRALPGPRWRHAGPLRGWRDSLASLSGYRPVIRRLPPDLSALDTLRLRGFDSPMLPRSRRYAEGDIRQPPLLMPEVATTDSLLFALNLRPGRLRIDAFGPGGQLKHRLTAPASARGQDVYPRALAARRRADGSYALSVALTKPQPAVRLYRWRPSGDAETPLAGSRR